MIHYFLINADSQLHLSMNGCYSKVYKHNNMKSAIWSEELVSYNTK